MQHEAPSERPIAVQLSGVDKYYGEFQALSQVDLEVRKGEKIVICGPSGSGKSTLIRCINRLEPHDCGRIVVNGIEVTRTPRPSRMCGSKSGWCSSNSICFRI